MLLSDYSAAVTACKQSIGDKKVKNKVIIQHNGRIISSRWKGSEIGVKKEGESY